MAGPIKQKAMVRVMPATASGPGRDENLAFFHLIQAIHNGAARRAGGYEDRFFNIGDRPVRLRFTGRQIAPVLTPALSHLEIGPTEAPELTVLIWDDATTGTTLPLAVARYLDSLGEWWLHLGPRGEIKRRTDGHIYAAYHLGPNILSMLNTENALALYWVHDARALPYYEVGSPLRTILHWWADTGMSQLVHAGAVGNADGGVLLAGKGGSGKSTTALACVDAGMLYASDDYCMIRIGAEPRVYSLYNTAKLRADEDVRRFPRLAPLVHNQSRLETDKALLFLQAHFPGQVSAGFPLKAIVLPRVAQGRKSRLLPARRPEILAALAPSTIFQLPGAGPYAMRTLCALSKQVPGYHLDLGTDLHAIPAVISKLLAEAPEGLRA